MLKKIDSSAPIPKYYQISESLKAQIAGGKLRPGDRVHSSRKLAEYFNTTQVTVLNALRCLEREGCIEKIQGKGVFVRAAEAAAPAHPAGGRQAGLIMPTKADLYQNLAEAMIAELQERNYYAAPLGNYLTNDAFSREAREARLQQYAAANFEALVLEGTRHVPYRDLHRHRGRFRQLDFVVFYETKLEFPGANKIVCDFYQAGLLGGRHLLARGKRRLAMLTFEAYSAAMTSRHGCVAETFDYAIAAGMKQAMTDAGLNCATDFSIIHDAVRPASASGVVESRIEDFMRAGECGILAVGDHRALKIYHVASKLKLTIGGEVSVAGLFNTAWVDIIAPALTSISVSEAQIGKLAARCIIEQTAGEHIVVSPELIVRES